MEYNKHCKKMKYIIADEFMKIFGFKRCKPPKNMTHLDYFSKADLLWARENHKDLNNRSYLLGFSDAIDAVDKELKMYRFIPEIISWETIEGVMGKKEYKKFLKWMNGQTCVQEGVYSWDLENYLRGGKSFD